MRFVKLIILSLTILAFCAGPALASDAGDVFSWLLSKPQGSLDFKSGTRRIVEEEDLTNFDYKWRWDIHVAVVRFKINEFKGKVFQHALVLVVRQYKTLVSPRSRQYTEWFLTDFGADGTLDKCVRFYNVLAKQEQDEAYYHIFPDYPDGFHDKGWQNPPIEEAQELYQHELDFWLERKAAGPKVPL